MKRVSAKPLLYEFNRHEPVRARIASGERLIVESEDALSGQIRQPGDVRDKQTMPYSNPVAGPIWVEGAVPGDSLAGGALSVARAIVRRAERRVVELHDEQEVSNPDLQRYLNRLSSLCFVLELLENKAAGNQTTLAKS